MILNTKAAAKTLLYLYQRTFWYIGQAKNELLKPLGFWNETLLILTFLAVNDTRPSVPVIFTAYIVVLIAAAIFGKIIVVMGIVSYNTKIANHQNPELMEIHKEIKEVLEVVRKQDHPHTPEITDMYDGEEGEIYERCTTCGKRIVQKLVKGRRRKN